MNYIYYNEFGKEIKKSLSPIAKGSSGIKIYIFSDFDNSSATEYEVSASFKKADGFVAGDIFLPLSSNTKINPYNQQAMYYRELTIGNDVTDIVGGLQLSIRYIQTNIIEVDPDVTYEEEVIHVTGMVTFNIYDATSFISPPQNTALINLKNYLLNYIDTQDANIFEVDRTFLQSLGVTNDLTVYGKIFAHGGLDSRANKIINVAPPENPLDAVNKSYVDTATDHVKYIELKAWQATTPSIANTPYYNTTDKKVHYWNNDNHIWESSGHEGFIYKWSVSYYKFTAGEGLTYIGTVPTKTSDLTKTDHVKYIELKAWQATTPSIANTPYYNTTDKKVHYWNNDNHIWESSGHEGFIYKWSVSYYKFTAGEGLTYIGTVPTKTSDLTNDSGFATETYVNNKVSSVYKLKGSVADYSSLPTENLTVGDVYNLLDTGDNYVWDGQAWDKLGGTFDLSSYELSSNKVIAWSETTNDTRYPSEKLVKDSLEELENTIQGVSDLSPYHYEGTFVGGDILQNDFDNLIVAFEDLRGYEYAFKETKLQGSYFVCSADSAFYFNPYYHWSAAEGTGKTSAITYTWAAPYDLNGLTEINMKPGDIISILDFSYNSVSNTISTLIKVEKNLEENFVVKNDTIVGATKAKITYDEKGLVTAGADLTVDDIPSLPITKIEGLSATGQNVQSNWTQTVNTADDFIKNKPTIPTVTNDLTNTLKSNYNAAYTHSTQPHAPSNAEQNVQSNWTQTVNTADDFIKNKPTIPTKTSDLTNDSGFVNTAYAYTLPQASTNTRGGIRADIKQVTDTVEVKIDVASEKLFVPIYPTVPTKTSDLTNNSGFATETYVNNKVSAVYKPKGSVPFSSLVVGLLVPANNGFVYNITNAFTTNANFVEGAGKSHSAGTNVVIIEHSGNYKFDVLSGTVDLTPYQLLSNKVTSFNAPTDVQYPSAKLVKDNLDAINVGLKNIGSLSPLRFAGYFTGGTVSNDFNNLIRPFENLTEALPDFYINNIKGAMFVCSAASDFVFNVVYTWADGVKTTPITFNWAAPYDLNGIGTTNFKVGDTISILKFAYDTVENEMFILVKVEKNLEEIIPDASSLLPKSGGTLENYNEKLTTLSTSSGAINLSLGSVFVQTPSANISYSITNAVSGVAHSFTLIVNMGAIVRTLTFPASVKWQGGTIPDLTTASKTYILTFLTVNGGTTWLGMFGGEF